PARQVDDAVEHAPTPGTVPPPVPDPNAKTLLLRKSGPAPTPAPRDTGGAASAASHDTPAAGTLYPALDTQHSSPEPPARKRVLVVEDNGPNRVMLCRRLEKHGYVTVEARDGREALDQVRKHTFDLVLCDIMMPEVDGYEVLRELKADPDLQALPVIMISAVAEIATWVQGIA